jgi:hypothetical protein
MGRCTFSACRLDPRLSNGGLEQEKTEVTEADGMTSDAPIRIEHFAGDWSER